MTDTVTTVSALALPEREAYVTRAQLAQIMGVSVDSVDRLVAAGMPSETWGMRARRFKPSIAIAWARERAANQPAPDDRCDDPGGMGRSGA